MTEAAVTSIEVAPGELFESLSAVRLCERLAEQEMQLSLTTLGQLTPVQDFSLGGRLEIFDGLKRVRAGRQLSWPRLRVEVHALDSAGAKVRLLRCNAAAGLSQLEEAWLVPGHHRAADLRDLARGGLRRRLHRREGAGAEAPSEASAYTAPRVPGDMAECDWSSYPVVFTHEPPTTLQAFGYGLRFSTRKYFVTAARTPSGAATAGNSDSGHGIQLVRLGSARAISAPQSVVPAPRRRPAGR